MSIISWSIEDDQLLMALKDQRGLGWKQIACHFNNRTPNACQFRWRRLKSGTLKSRRHMWSSEEDKLIMSTNLTITEISILLPQKSIGEIIDRRKRLATKSKLSIGSLLNTSSNLIVLPPLNKSPQQQTLLPPVSSIL